MVFDILVAKEVQNSFAGAQSWVIPVLAAMKFSQGLKFSRNCAKVRTPMLNRSQSGGFSGFADGFLL